jgi:UPF0271 protein
MPAGNWPLTPGCALCGRMRMAREIDLNADLGEAWGVYPGPQQVWRSDWDRGAGGLAPSAPLSGGSLDEILAVISSASLACGYHAGDPVAIKRYAIECVTKGISIGAHPSYPDPAGFGNRSMALSHQELVSAVQYQIAALDGFARLAGGNLRHVKLHGALYHDAHSRADVATAVAEAIAEYAPSLVVFGMPGSALDAACLAAGLRYAREGFPDRAYAPNGSLVPRSETESMICIPEKVAERAVSMAADGCVAASDGSTIALTVETLCIHPDTPNAPKSAREVRRALEARGIAIARIV